METEDKTGKGQQKGLHWGILTTLMLHEEFCEQSIWEDAVEPLCEYLVFVFF